MEHLNDAIKINISLYLAKFESDMVIVNNHEVLIAIVAAGFLIFPLEI